MQHENNIKEIGVVGLGLMGCSIISALLIAGNKVVALAPLSADMKKAPSKINHYLDEAYEHGFSVYTSSENLSRLTFTEDYSDLKNCCIAMECVSENLEIKKQIYINIENHLPHDAILTTNTSA